MPIVVAFATLPLVLPGELSASLSPPAEHVLESASAAVQVTLDWHNGWRDARSHDAAWLVLREANAPLAPVLRLAPDGHLVTGEPAARVVVAADGVGAFIEPTSPHRGEVHWNVTLRLAADPPAQVEPWAVEMVFIAGGAFEAGDDAPGVAAKGALRSFAGGPYLVDSEAALSIGEAHAGIVYDSGKHPEYVGDGAGPVPAAFPKGTQAFYVMKYELTQGAYARFLNALPPAWRALHSPDGLEGEETDTCSLERKDDRWVARAPRRPCNFVSWSDTAAWADWMGLRPMTELEFEKAARGPQRPVPGDFPWGTATREGVARKVLPSRDLAAASRADEALLQEGNGGAAARIRLAASYYGVHDLSGSLWERVVSLGHPVGRAFTGSHGDGLLADGLATNVDWPRQTDREAPGIGYRGGADYFGGEPNETNPFSCVGTRQYGGWAGAYRYKTYSARAVRTAPSKD